MLCGIYPSALAADISVCTAVELTHVFAPCKGMEPVDILGYDRKKLSLLLKPCKSPVGGVGTGVRTEHLLPVEPVKFFGFGVEKFVGENCLGGIVVFL